MRTIPFGRPFVAEEEKSAVLRVLRGPVLTHGSEVQEFERLFGEYTGGQHAVATASCTAAMHLAYMHAGIRRGDEVIVPAQTHVATAHAVELCGGTCVFADSEPETGNVDLDQVEALVTPRTRALAVVHYLGMPVNMDRVVALSRKHDLLVVEDCALALGSTYRGQHVGLFGDAGCFSFYPVKHITTAEGGMVITRKRDLAAGVATLRAFGIDHNIPAERRVPGVYDVDRLGLNYRMSELNAALGVTQLGRLPTFLKKRCENFERLGRQLRELDEVTLLQSSHDEHRSSYYCMTAVLRDPWWRRRAAIRQYLQDRGVGTSVYYPRPVPQMTYYQQRYGFEDTGFPVARRLSERSIALPVGPHVEEADIEYMIAKIKDALVKAK